jgi:hypothetical protein
LHQDVAGRRSRAARVLALYLGIAWLPAHADSAAGATSGPSGPSGPSGEMMAPVRALAAFMSTVPPRRHAAVFAPGGACIVENFAPYLFCGPDAAARWESGFRAHFADDWLEELSAEFGAAQDFGVTGRRAYFSLPTTWRGLSHGRRFEEHGAWAFVLERGAGGWRIKSYGWGVTSYSESAP